MGEIRFSIWRAGLQNSHTPLRVRHLFATLATPARAKMVRASGILLVLVAILFPPAAAGILTGCSCDLLINIALTLLGYVPGHLHCFYLIYKKMQAEERYGPDVQYFGNAEWGPAGAGAGQYHPVGVPPPPLQQQQGYQTTY